MGDQRQRPCHPCASSSDGKGEQLRSSQQRDPRTEARTSRERLAARRSWNGHLLRIILWTGADVLFHICLGAFSKAPSCRCTRSLCENISHRKKPACALVSWSGPHCSAWRAGRLDVRDNLRPHWLLSRLSLPKTRFEHSDGVVRQEPDTRQCRRTVRRAVCRAHLSRAKRGSEPHCNRSRISRGFAEGARR